MRDYVEIFRSLRICADGNCPECDYWGEAGNGCYFNLKEDAADAIEELLVEKAKIENSGKLLAAAFERLKEKVPTWISVEERMPHYLDHVLCVNKFGIQMVGYLTDYKEGGFRCESGMDSCDYITHWMPLPAPPEGGNHDN